MPESPEHVEMVDTICVAAQLYADAVQRLSEAQHASEGTAPPGTHHAHAAQLKQAQRVAAIAREALLSAALRLPPNPPPTPEQVAARTALLLDLRTGRI